VKFVLVDRITALEPGKRIVAQKALTLAEEYLADHFPRFPVLPGVLMVESMVQASAWLARVSLDFAPSIVVLQEARNITFKSFLTPGQVLTLESECKELEPERSQYSAAGHADGREIVKARLTLRHVSLADVDPAAHGLDDGIRRQMRALFGLLWAEQSPPATPRLD